MTPWLVHGLRAAGLDVACLDARRVKAALQMQLNKTDENDAEGLAQIMRTGWYRAVHVKSLDAHRARAPLGARAQLVGMTTRLSNMIRGVLKTFGLLPGAGRGLRFDRKVEALLEGAPEIALVVRPLLATWRQLRQQIAVFEGGAAAGQGGSYLSSADDSAGYRCSLLADVRGTVARLGVRRRSGIPHSFSDRGWIRGLGFEAGGNRGGRRGVVRGRDGD